MGHYISQFALSSPRVADDNREEELGKIGIARALVDDYLFTLHFNCIANSGGVTPSSSEHSSRAIVLAQQ